MSGPREWTPLRSWNPELWAAWAGLGQGDGPDGPDGLGRCVPPHARRHWARALRRGMAPPADTWGTLERCPLELATPRP